MTDFKLCGSTVEQHKKELEEIAATVQKASETAANRLGPMDFGALFVSLVPLVNFFLDQTNDSITRRQKEIASQTEGILATVREMEKTDQSGADAVTDAGPR